MAAKEVVSVNATKMQVDEDNDTDEEMDTDGRTESKESDSTILDDVEEGELSDSKNMDSPQAGNLVMVDSKRRYDNKEGGFFTGVDICGEEEQSKLGERAKRFGLDPSTVKPLTEQDFKKLYASLGMTTEEGIEKTFRLDALHMRGTENMSTNDVFKYFRAFGPASVEWINDVTCNVVWLEELSAARALIGLSRQIKGLAKLRKTSQNSPKIAEEKLDKEEVVVTEDESDSDVEAEVDGSSGNQHEKLAGAKTVASAGSDDELNAVDADTITIPIPPGNWRVGITHPKAKNILLRFATRTDKKHPRAEKLSEYYKKYGNPNYGGIPGILTESRKRRFRKSDQYSHYHYSEKFTGENKFRTARNPWGNLAKNWGNAGNPEYYGKYNPPRPPIIQSYVTAGSQERQAGNESDSGSASSNSDSEEMSTKTKVPRMRMYADEEEMKIEKRKAQKSKQSGEDEIRSQHQHDLRHRLRRESRGQSVEKYQNRDRYKHSPERPHRVNSTVWSRLHHKQSKDNLVDNEHYKEKRQYMSTSTFQKLSHFEDSDDVNERPLHFKFGDLRSKLNSMKTVRKKSPLRIEVDNDEYYRVIGSESE